MGLWHFFLPLHAYGAGMDVNLCSMLNQVPRLCSRGKKDNEQRWPSQMIDTARARSGGLITKTFQHL